MSKADVTIERIIADTISETEGGNPELSPPATAVARGLRFLLRYAVNERMNNPAPINQNPEALLRGAGQD